MKFISFALVALSFTGGSALPHPTNLHSKDLMGTSLMAQDAIALQLRTSVEAGDRKLQKRASIPPWLIPEGSILYISRLAQWALEEMAKRTKGKQLDEIADDDPDFCIWMNYVEILARHQVYEAPDQATHDKWWEEAKDQCRRGDPNSAFNRFYRLWFKTPPRGEPGNNIVIDQQKKSAGLLRAPKTQLQVFQQRQSTQQQSAQGLNGFGKIGATARNLQGWKPPSIEQTAAAGAGLLTTGAAVAAQKAGLFRDLVWGN